MNIIGENNRSNQLIVLKTSLPDKHHLVMLLAETSNEILFSY